MFINSFTFSEDKIRFTSALFEDSENNYYTKCTHIYQNKILNSKNPHKQNPRICLKTSILHSDTNNPRSEEQERCSFQINFNCALACLGNTQEILAARAQLEIFW